MKYLLTLFILGIFSLTSYSQQKSIKAIEVGLIPFVFYNNLSFGYSWKKQLNEHVVYSKSYFHFIPYASGYASSVLYNYNRYLSGNLSQKFYIPFSLAAKYENYYSYEGNADNENWVKFFIGSGIGFKPQVYRFKLRFELLLGGTLNTEYYKERLRLDDQFPIFPAIKMNTRFVFDLKQKRPTKSES